MILHNKSLYAFLGMMVMSLSLQAAGPDAVKPDVLKELLKRPAGTKLTFDKNGNVQAVDRTKMDKAKAVTKTGFYAVAVGLLAHAAAHNVAPQGYEEMASILTGLVTNLYLNRDVVDTVLKDRSKLKDPETLATLAALVGGSVEGNYVGDHMYRGTQWVKAKMKPSKGNGGSSTGGTI